MGNLEFRSWRTRGISSERCQTKHGKRFSRQNMVMESKCLLFNKIFFKLSFGFYCLFPSYSFVCVPSAANNHEVNNI